MTIAFFGDSTIAGVDGDYPESNPDIRFCTPLTAYVFGSSNFGVGSQTLAMLLDGIGDASLAYGGHTILPFADHVAALDGGSTVVLEAGINDSESSDTDFLSDLNEAIDTVQGYGLTIILQTPNRMTNSRYASVANKAQVIRSRAAARSVPLIDIQYGVTVPAPQGVHPNTAGYQIMGEYAAKRLAQIADSTFIPKQQQLAALTAIT